MTTRYRFNADKGEVVPPETDEERHEREAREVKEAKDTAWRLEQEERERKRVGDYL